MYAPNSIANEAVYWKHDKRDQNIQTYWALPDHFFITLSQYENKKLESQIAVYKPLG